MVPSRSRGWKVVSAVPVRESTRCRPGGWSSDCPGPSLLPLRKAFWVATCTCAKHNLFGDVIGLLDGCCHGNPLSGISLVGARPRNEPCHDQLCFPNFQVPTYRSGPACLGGAAAVLKGNLKKKLGVVSPWTKEGLARVPGYLL